MKFAFFLATAASARNAAQMGPHPGYSGDLDVQGTAGIRFGSQSFVELWWELTGLDADCDSKTHLSVTNACSIMVYDGDCTDATSFGDALITVPYSSDARGSRDQGSKVYTGSVSHLTTVVVHDKEGARVSCGELPAINRATMGPHPGYSGDLKVRGIADASVGGLTDYIHLRWDLRGLDADCDACSIMIYDADCTDAASFGDALTTFTYSSDEQGSSTGKGWMQFVGSISHLTTVVVHDKRGARVACGELPQIAPPQVQMV